MPWQFLRFNLLAGASAQYGGHPWHWNITQGLPAVAATLLPLLLAGLAWAGGGEGRWAGRGWHAAWWWQKDGPGFVSCSYGESTFTAQQHLCRTPACRLPALLAGWSLAAYSLPAHKEFRFLLPALQLLMPYCGLAAASLLSSCGSSQGHARTAAVLRRGGTAPAAPAWPLSPAAWQRFGAAACLLLQLPMAAYFVLAPSLCPSS